MNVREAAALGASPGRSDVIDGNTQSLPLDLGARKPQAKWRRVLEALIARPFLDRRIAAQDPAIRDSVLNSTISELAKRGLLIERAIVRRPGFQGQPAWLAEYKLPADQHDAARRLLADTSRRRGRRQ